MTLQQLLEEAIQQETEITDKRQRNIRQRLLQFRTHLITESKLKSSTVKAHMQQLYTLYHHYDIELPKLPPVKSNDIVKTTYYDLPTREQLNMVLDCAGIRLSSLILFMVSSGTARTECSNMKISDFINACKEYYTSETLPEIIEELSNNIDPIVPTFYLTRQKTGKQYYTFCTPETTNAIIEWLQLRLKICEEKDIELKMSDSLWDLSVRQITYHFSNINDELGFGFKGQYRFLRPHILRKFNASNIGLGQDNIDLLHGRSKNIIHETYIKTNPQWLREIYMNVMENVTLKNVSKKQIIKEDFTININLNFYDKTYGVTL